MFRRSLIPILLLALAMLPACSDGDSIVNAMIGSGSWMALLSPDAPAVNVQVANGSSKTFTETTFGESAGYSAVDAGTYDLEVRPASGGAPALAAPGVELSGGTNISHFAIGLAGDASLSALAVTDAH